jgi:hypothetical protein
MDEGEHKEALDAARRIVEARATEREAIFLHDALIVARALLSLSSRNTEMEGALGDLLKAIQRDDQAWLCTQEMPEINEAFRVTKGTP